MAASNNFIDEFNRPGYDYRMEFSWKGEEIVGKRYFDDGRKDETYPLGESTFTILPSSDSPILPNDTIIQLIASKYVPIVLNNRIEWLPPEEISEVSSVSRKIFSGNSSSAFSPLSEIGLSSRIMVQDEDSLLDIAIPFSSEERVAFMLRLAEIDKLAEKSIKKAEEACIQVLESLALYQEKALKYRFIEKIGDLYLRRGTRESLLQAAGAYNYVLLSERKVKNQEGVDRIMLKLAEVEKHLLSEYGCSIPSDSALFKTYAENRRKIKEIRANLASKLSSVSDDVDSVQVKKIQKEIAEGMIGFVRDLVVQSIKILGKPPCQFAVIGLGSLAREEMTPYSDLEFGILIEKENEATKTYFINLTYLFHLKVVNLGETILPTIIPSLSGRFFDSETPRGFAFDGKGTEGKGCKTPLGNGETFALLHTPEKMAHYVGKDEAGKWWFKKEPHLPMEMLNFVWITGNYELVNDYQKALGRQLSLPVIDRYTLREYLAKIHLKEEDEINFDPTTGMEQEDEGRLFQVKQDLYRLPQLFIERLVILQGIDSQNTIDRIRLLQQQGILGREAANNLEWLIGTVMLQRLKVYSTYQAQREFMNPLLHPFSIKEPKLVKKQFSLDPKNLERLKRIYQILIPFFHASQAYLKGNHRQLQEEVLLDTNPVTLGKIAARLLQYEAAENYYQKERETAPEDPKVLNALGIMCLQRGKYNEAFEYLLSAQSIIKSAPQKNASSDEAAILYSICVVLKTLGRHKEALSKEMQALQVSRNFSKENNFYIATILNNIGLTLGNLARYEESLTYLEQARKALITSLGGNHPFVAINLSNIGVAWWRLGKRGEALKYQIQAFELNKKLFGERHPSLAINLNNMGLVFYEDGQYSKAISCERQAFEIRKKLLGKDHPSVANSLTNIGLTYQKLGMLEEALKCQKKAVKLSERLYGNNNPLLAETLTNKGSVLEALKWHRDALKCWEQALEIYETTSGSWNLEVAKVLSNIECVLESLDRGEEACNWAKISYAMIKEFLGEDHPDSVAILNGLGMNFVKIGALEEAHKILWKLFKLTEEKQGEEHLDTATRASNLGAILERLGEHEDALYYKKKALQIRESFLDEIDPSITNILKEIAEISALLERHEEVLQNLKRLARISKEAYGEVHDQTLNDTLVIISYLKRIGKHDEVLVYQEKMLNALAAAFGDRDQYVGRAAYELGTTLAELKEDEKALIHLTQALEIFNQAPEHLTSYLLSTNKVIGEVFRRLGRNDEADVHEKKAFDMMQATEEIPEATSTLAVTSSSSQSKLDFHSLQLQLEEIRGRVGEAGFYFDLMKVFDDLESISLSIDKIELGEQINVKELIICIEKEALEKAQNLFLLTKDLSSSTEKFHLELSCRTAEMRERFYHKSQEIKGSDDFAFHAQFDSKREDHKGRVSSSETSSSDNDSSSEEDEYSRPEGPKGKGKAINQR